MAGTFFGELSKLGRAKRIASIVPARLKFKALRALYNYESEGVQGIDIVTPLQNDGLVCFVNTKDLIGWKIFFYGEYEASTNRILEKLVKKGDVVIEAGANIGSETLLLSRHVGDNGMIYGFEPNPYTFQRLKINVDINELSNVQVFELALGERDKDIHFNIYPKGFCNPGMSSKYMSTPITREISVKQLTLDSFVKEQGIKNVDFIKMDIQGAEMDLLDGSKEVITKYRPTIFTEAEDYFVNTEGLYNKLKGFGYDVSRINDNGVTTLLKSSSEIVPGNWIASAGK